MPKIVVKKPIGTPAFEDRKQRVISHIRNDAVTSVIDKLAEIGKFKNANTAEIMANIFKATESRHDEIVSDIRSCKSQYDTQVIVNKYTNIITDEIINEIGEKRMAAAKKSTAKKSTAKKSTAKKSVTPKKTDENAISSDKKMGPIARNAKIADMLFERKYTDEQIIDVVRDSEPEYDQQRWLNHVNYIRQCINNGRRKGLNEGDERIPQYTLVDGEMVTIEKKPRKERITKSDRQKVAIEKLGEYGIDAAATSGKGNDK